MKKQTHSSHCCLLAMSVALLLGSASCDDATDAVPSSPADGGAQDGGASGAQNAGTGAAGAAGLAGGDGGSGGVTEPVRVRVSGSAQKGPIAAGSSVTVFGLDSELESTGTAFPSQTEDDLGSFDLSANLSEEFIEVVAQGAFYDELTGDLSETSIVLRAIASAAPDTDLRVNLLTTASKNRIQYLFGQGREFEDAVAQAEEEVLHAFGIEDENLDTFTEMDITGTSASDATLIAVSAILLQYAEDHSDSEGQKVAQLSLAVSNLAKDLEEDGELNDAGLSAGIATAAVRLDVAAVTANLEDIYSGLGQSISVPDIQPVVDVVAAPAPWKFAPPLPDSRSGHCACVVNDKVYVMGGAGGVADDHPDDVLEYDPAAEEWLPKANVLLARAYPACSVVDGVIYVTGGLVSGQSSDAVEAYDPAQNTWTNKAPMPVPRLSHASTALDGKIYVIGGSQGQALDSVVVYDPVEDAWDALAPLPQKLYGPAAAASSGKIYVFGGSDNDGLSAATYEYDPIANTWTPRPAMPTARSNASAVEIGGRIYVIGGHDGTRPAGTVEEYDPLTNAWAEKSPMNVARNYAEGVLLDDLAYVVGGTILVDNQAPSTDVVETYDPLKDN